LDQALQELLLLDPSAPEATTSGGAAIFSPQSSSNIPASTRSQTAWLSGLPQPCLNPDDLLVDLPDELAIQPGGVCEQMINTVVLCENVLIKGSVERSHG
jgi:hypothetical protein